MFLTYIVMTKKHNGYRWANKDWGNHLNISSFSSLIFTSCLQLNWPHEKSGKIATNRNKIMKTKQNKKTKQTKKKTAKKLEYFYLACRYLFSTAGAIRRLTVIVRVCMQINFTELIRAQNDKSYLYDELTRCTCLEDNNLVRISLTLAELAVFVFLFFVFLFFFFHLSAIISWPYL